MRRPILVLLLSLAAVPVAQGAPAGPLRAHSGCAGRAALGTPRVAYVGIARGSTTAFRLPSRRPFERFGRLNVNGFRTLFSIREVVFDRGCHPSWYHVQLPVKPNGITGWISARSLSVGTVTTRILVDLSDRRLTFFRSGRAILRVPVAIGSRSTPTPRGLFYVNQRLVSRHPTGPFGPAALGISAFSPALTYWTQGGPIAVHGTNHPEWIGRAVSTGCIRVKNSVMRRLFAETPAGTPVLIQA